MRRVGPASLAGLTPGRKQPAPKQGDLTTMLDDKGAAALPALAEAPPPRDRWREVRSAIAEFFRRVPAAPPPPGPDPRLQRFQARRGLAD